MNIIQKTYTVESVTAGHPDKICDQISDAALDECLREDPMSRVAVEAFGSHGLIVVGGEVTTRANVNFGLIAENIYKKVGHEDPVKILVNIAAQSPDIAQGVDTGGAGDQGIMYGYATDETAEFLPKGVVLGAHQNRHYVPVLDRHLRLAVGPEPRDAPISPEFLEPAG